MDTILKAGDSIAPASSKKPSRKPITISILLAIRRTLDLNKGRDAAVWACATCLFYGVACLGELTVPTIKEFDTTIHVHRANITQQIDRHGHQVTAVFIPKTKASLHGEELSIARQNDPTDPEAALQNHFRINDPALNTEHLFTHNFKNSRVPLSRYIFLQRLKEVSLLLTQQGAEEPFPVNGHSFRIGGTLEYFLRGVPFDVVKSIGRWASEAFQLYLRKHAQVLAPYLQDRDVFGNFTRISMPPVRAGRRGR